MGAAVTTAMRSTGMKGGRQLVGSDDEMRLCLAACAKRRKLTVTTFANRAGSSTSITNYVHGRNASTAVQQLLHVLGHHRFSVVLTSDGLFDAPLPASTVPDLQQSLQVIRGERTVRGWLNECGLNTTLARFLLGAKDNCRTSVLFELLDVADLRLLVTDEYRGRSAR